MFLSANLIMGDQNVLEGKELYPRNEISENWDEKKRPGFPWWKFAAMYGIQLRSVCYYNDFSTFFSPGIVTWLRRLSSNEIGMNFYSRNFNSVTEDQRLEARETGLMSVTSVLIQ